MRILFLVITLISVSLAWAQVEPKGPRVIELEEKIEADASKYLNQRFPGSPYFIKVDVQPLRSELKKGEYVENLPYLNYETEDYVDAWEDPNISISYLRNRVKKISLDVSVSEGLQDKDVQEIRDSLMSFLKLISFRDEIKVEKRLQVAKNTTPEFVYYILGSLALLLFGIGFWVRTSVKTIAKSVGGQASSNAGNSMPMMSSGGGGVGSDSNFTVKDVPPIRGDINFFDPIKLIEVLHLKIKQIVTVNHFPTLQDMIILEKLSETNPGALGALVSEFPQDIQKNIFQLGRTEKWIEAFAYPTKVDQTVFQSLEDISRSRDIKKSDYEFENLLIQLWRLGDKLPVFLKEINPDHAFSILGRLPKSIALKYGKKAYPGNWGKILEDSHSNIVIDANLVKDYLKKAIAINPPLEYALVDSYKKEKEVMEYVRAASIEDERDIYETLSHDSFIVKTRAPFYRVFELDEAKFSKVTEKFSIQEWALALINSSRVYIKQYADTLDEKKKYMFSVSLKNLDEKNIKAHEQMLIREKIASFAKTQFEDEINLNVLQPSGELPLENKTA
ncbi:MAG: hypothetical protein ACOVP4_04985 [Bacteriovoracaceae bacterium]